MRPPERLTGYLDSWRADAVLAAGLIVTVVAYSAADGILQTAGQWAMLGCAIGFSASIVVRRNDPILAAIAAGCVAGLASLGSLPDLPATLMLMPVFLLAYSLGASSSVRLAAAALVILGAGVQAANGPVFNPFIIVVLIGPFAVGLVARSRRRLAEQLEARGRELDAERELFAAEAVRYERARIARELHDIVAHCISVMVIQASAGQRLAASDPALAAEAFDSIADVVRQAESEIGMLVELLHHDTAQPGRDGIRLIDELVARAAAAGLRVSCRFTGSADGLPGRASDAAYRVVQESLTNALKHAPGSPVEVLVAASDGHVQIGVVNGPPAAPPSGLEQAGGGRGLAGMRERVRTCGGDLTAGPAADGGWHVLARLPRQPDRAGASLTG